MLTYSPEQIADELTKTALGESYHGNALYVAMDFPCVSAEDIPCLTRYMHGSITSTDHVKLQQIANKIREFKQ